MQIASSQYQLFAEAKELPADEFGWHFVLQSPDRSLHLDVTDQEPGAAWERLELLAVVRGLEALDQPSRVTLLTPSRYVSHGLRYGLAEWREAGWLWESFGQMTPVKHEDLWRRVDQALEFHRVACRICRLDGAHIAPPTPEYVTQRSRPTVRRRRKAVEAGPRVVLSKRTKVQVDDVRKPWSIRERVASVLMGLGQAIAPQVAAAS
jgi:ribonuclease HI